MCDWFYVTPTYSPVSLQFYSITTSSDSTLIGGLNIVTVSNKAYTSNDWDCMLYNTAVEKSWIYSIVIKDVSLQKTKQLTHKYATFTTKHFVQIGKFFYCVSVIGLKHHLNMDASKEVSNT